MEIKIARGTILNEPDVSQEEVSQITIMVNTETKQGQELIQQMMELSSLMERAQYIVTDASGPVYEFKAFANVQFGNSNPTNVVLAISGPITMLR